jgi:outer membrane protein
MRHSIILLATLLAAFSSYSVAAKTDIQIKETDKIDIDNKGQVHIDIQKEAHFKQNVIHQKIALVDWREALMNSNIAKKEIAKMRTLLETEQDKLTKHKNKLSQEQQELQKDIELMTEKEQNVTKQKFVVKVQEYNFLVQQLQQVQIQKENALLEQMRPKMSEAVNQIVERDSYDLVLNKATVVFFKPAHDITPDVIKLLNALHLKQAK